MSSIFEDQIAEAQGRLDAARAERQRAIEALAATPTDKQARADFLAANSRVDEAQADLKLFAESNQIALVEAQRQFRCEQYANAIAAGDAAVATVERRSAACKKIDQAVGALASAVQEFASISAEADDHLAEQLRALTTAGNLAMDAMWSRSALACRSTSPAGEAIAVPLAQALHAALRGLALRDVLDFRVHYVPDCTVSEANEEAADDLRHRVAIFSADIAKAMEA